MKTVKTKYFEIYNNSKDKNDFITKFLKEYPQLKKQTALRRWYDVSKSEKQTPISKQYNNKDKVVVSGAKLLLIKDMVHYKQKLSRPYLKKYGYNDAEINYLIDEKIITLEKDGVQNNNTGDKEE